MVFIFIGHFYSVWGMAPVNDLPKYDKKVMLNAPASRQAYIKQFSVFSIPYRVDHEWTTLMESYLTLNR